MEEILKEAIKNLPRSAGVYLFADKRGKTIYVGKAINLLERGKTYLGVTLDPKTRMMVSQIAKVNYLKVLSEFDGLLLEAALIKKYQPKYNVRLKDGKSFLYIAVTKEEFPKVFATRKNDIINPKYLFGPFPSAKTVRQILRFLRKIFPYCSQKGTSRPCFWSYLGLCRPCPGEIAKLTGPDREVKKKTYLTNIKNLVAIFLGKSKKLVGELTSQMEEAAKQEDFEKAASLRDQIKKLSWLAKPHSPISSYLEKANFLEEVKKKEQAHFPHRIEGYDVSNIAGFYATGSMVVFLDGLQSKEDYRRFMIKISGKPNDTAMISEVLRRRLRHKEWSFPQLMVIDGGKGQVSKAIKLLTSLGLKIPVIGLAKRLEETVMRGENGKWEIGGLPDDSPVLSLLKRIRDEAHRFALAYHRKLRAFGLT